MAISHEDVVKRFADRTVNKRMGFVWWNGNNVYCRDDVIFSYGSHFPMAKYLGISKAGHKLFIKNSDGYSSSTSRHQGKVRKYCPGPSVSRWLLKETTGYHFHFEDLTIENIHLWRAGIEEFLWHDTQTDIYYQHADYRVLGPTDPEPTEPWVLLKERTKSKDEDPFGLFKVVNFKRQIWVFEEKNSYSLAPYGSFKEYKKQEHERFQTGRFIAHEALVLKIDNKFFLWTQGQMTELDREPKTIDQALKRQKRSLQSV